MGVVVQTGDKTALCVIQYFLWLCNLFASVDASLCYRPKSRWGSQLYNGNSLDLWELLPAWQLPWRSFLLSFGLLGMPHKLACRMSTEKYAHRLQKNFPKLVTKSSLLIILYLLWVCLLTKTSMQLVSIPCCIVAFIPEGLPIVVTLSLRRIASALKKHGILCKWEFHSL